MLWYAVVATSAPRPSHIRTGTRGALKRAGRATGCAALPTDAVSRPRRRAAPARLRLGGNDDQGSYGFPLRAGPGADVAVAPGADDAACNLTRHQGSVGFTQQKTCSTARGGRRGRAVPRPGPRPLSGWSAPSDGCLGLPEQSGRNFLTARFPEVPAVQPRVPAAVESLSVAGTLTVEERRWSK